MRRRLEARGEEAGNLPLDLREVRGVCGGIGRAKDSNGVLDRAAVLRRGALERHRVLDDPNPEILRGQLGPAEAGRIDALEVVLRAHRAVDEGGQRLRASIRAIPDANADLEPETIGRAVYQLDPRHAYLPVDEAADPLDRMVVADPHPDRVREAREVRVGEGVLVQRRHETVDGAGADLENGFEVTREQVGHENLSAATTF